jgi:serine/threonine protein kinase
VSSKYDKHLKDALQAAGHFKHDYQVLKTLGQGAFCKVKLAVHTPTQEKVAIKIYDKKKLIEMEGEAGFAELTEEGKLLSELHNDHVVRLYEIVDTPDFYYMVIEVASGGEVFDYIIAHGHVEEDEACKIFHQCMHALEYIHSHNIVHRDLKPENLLMTRHRDIKLIDFGFSERWTPGKPLVKDVGSPFYVAPEVVTEDKVLMMKTGPPLDIWAMGVILYVLVTGEPPFVGDERYDDDGEVDQDYYDETLFKRIENGSFPLEKLNYISTDLKKLLKIMICVDPDKRATFEQIRATAWYKTYHDPANEMGAHERVDGDVDDEIVAMVAKMGHDEKEIREQLGNNTCNNATATYYLLAKKKVRAVRSTTATGKQGRTSSTAAGDRYTHHAPAKDKQHGQGAVHAGQVDDAEEAVKEIEATFKHLGIKYKEKPQHSKGAHTALKCTDTRDAKHHIVFMLTLENINPSSGNEFSLHLQRIKGEAMRFKKVAREVVESCQETMSLHHIAAERQSDLGVENPLHGASGNDLMTVDSEQVGAAPSSKGCCVIA